MHIPFNDARRLRKADSDISVPFVMKNNSSTQRAERLPYAYDELNSNENAPEDPGIFQKHRSINKGFSLLLKGGAAPFFM